MTTAWPIGESGLPAEAAALFASSDPVIYGLWSDVKALRHLW
jgi:hypothetical protein